MTKRGHHVQLLDGLLVCAVCGDKTYVNVTYTASQPHYQYVCAATKRALRRCQPARISVRLADGAVLRQVERLQGQPWSDDALDRALHQDPNEPLRAQLQAAMAAVKERMGELAQRMATVRDVGPEFMDTVKAQAGKLELEMGQLRAQLAALPQRQYDPVKARRLHDTLMAVDLHQCVLDARRQGDVAVLRDILAMVVKDARIVERGSESGKEGHATWARARVTWTENVELLLAAGRLTLGVEPEGGPRPCRKERHREAVRRYRARKRAQAAQP